MGEIGGPRCGPPAPLRRPDVSPEVTPAPPENSDPKPTPGPRRADPRNQAEPRLRNKEPAAESRADRHHPPPSRPRVKTAFDQVGSERAPRPARRKGDPRSVLTCRRAPPGPAQEGASRGPRPDLRRGPSQQGLGPGCRSFPSGLTERAVP